MLLSKSFYVSFLLSTIALSGFTQEDSARLALNGMCTTFLNLKAIQVKQLTVERVNETMQKSLAEAKVQFEPKRKIYIRAVDDEGEVASEVLYVEGENENEALVNPVSFPYINLDLDPNGNIMRKNRHHTIFEAGGKYLAQVIKESVDKAIEVGEFKKRFFYKGQVEHKGYTCHHVEIYNADYALDNYTVKPSEDVVDIARKLMVPEYKILEANEDLDHYDDVSEGDQITVPRFYGKRIVLYIDTHTFIPWYQRIEDEKGVFAEYFMKACYLNPEFTEETFSPENEAYGF